MEVAAIVAFPDEAADHTVAKAAAAQLIISLHVISSIRTKDMMHLHVYIHGHRLLTLLDSSSTHNFINTRVMRQL